MFRGSLFTNAFLEEGIRYTATWQAVDDDELEAFREGVRAIFDHFPVDGSPSEAQTVHDLILPVLDQLGWHDYIPELRASRKGRQDIPDILLFGSPDEKQRANAEAQPADYFRHGLVIAENKAWEKSLDRSSAGRGALAGVPSNQILRYLSVAETQSEQRVQWGLLTNGRHWRLYYQKARSRSEQFLEIDLAAAVGVSGIQGDLFDAGGDSEHWLRVFYLLFRKAAFLPQEPDERTFHHIALDEGRHWEARVTGDLTKVVFHTVYPELLTALAESDPEAPAVPDKAYLQSLQQAALTLLFRLLFILYAEDRHLLPVQQGDYDDYGMRKRVREDIATRRDSNDVLSDKRPAYYRHLRDLFRAIHEGDASIGLPPYNGGLFDPAQTPILDRTELPDARLAPLVDALSRHHDGYARNWINYRDLSVQHLGSIYEGLLAYEPVPDPQGGVTIQPQPLARKGSGSYYTPEDLVQLILERTVGPLVAEQRVTFENHAAQMASDPRPNAQRVEALRGLDPAENILGLNICDPAMGSGHFLVSLVDYLADRVLESVSAAEMAVDWADADAPYTSPVPERVAAIREHIQAEADRGGWTVDLDQLSDRLLIRRMILKRCVYGVDKNPMAVELAKVSLWLHTFTVGAPLSFLDHHLRPGDSLFGEWIGPLEDKLAGLGAMFLQPSIRHAKAAARGMAEVETITDADIGEAHRSAELYRDSVEKQRSPLRDFLDLMHAWRWLEQRPQAENAQERKQRQTRERQALRAYIDGQFGDPIRIASGENDPDITAAAREEGATFVDLLARARQLTAHERFLHWEVAFPLIWEDWESRAPRGGFDAIIGNPPWERVKLQEVEWFATRRPKIAGAQRQADRKRLINGLRESGDPLVADYEDAAWRAEAAARVAREGGQYPLLGHGDVNLYSLLVERAFQLIRPAGMVGLLTPSGIAADRGASAFFSRIATGGRLAAFFDFENRGIFFPDVHRSFKFATFVAGGPERTFDAAECAFFLHDTEAVHDPDKAFTLRARDFANVNPNTGTAPVFRRTRDAEITTTLYERVPVLVDRRTEPPARVWPVRYFNMFHMTNDSGLFKNRPALEEEGCYPVAGNRWRRGAEEYVPLYEGKMVQAFDHRAASVEINPDNIHRPAQTREATAEEHADPDWLPAPQFWVPNSEVEWPPHLGWCIGFKHVTAPTNVRTMIASIIPFAGTGNSLPLLVPDTQAGNQQEMVPYYKRYAPLLVANLNSFIFDYVTRSKVQGQNLNWYIVEQLPFLPESAYATRFGDKTAEEMIREEVLALTFTAWDLALFAQDLGYRDEPFPWDPEDRRHRCARLDALFFLLYGLDEPEAADILSTFPIVRDQDEKAFGRFRTEELIRGYMRALQAGDTETRLAI